MCFCSGVGVCVFLEWGGCVCVLWSGVCVCMERCVCVCFGRWVCVFGRVCVCVLGGVCLGCVCLGARVLRCSGAQGLGVNDILEGQKGDLGGGPKKAKNQYCLKPDIFNITT